MTFSHWVVLFTNWSVAARLIHPQKLPSIFKVLWLIRCVQPTVHRFRRLCNEPVSPTLQRLVASMLDKEAAKRPTAEQVLEELRAAGFSPGPAKIKVAARPVVADERVQTVESIHPATRAGAIAAPDVAAASDSGISAKTLGIALVVLLLVLLGVVFK
jgi:hypothetical protein